MKLLFRIFKHKDFILLSLLSGSGSRSWYGERLNLRTYITSTMSSLHLTLPVAEQAQYTGALQLPAAWGGPSSAFYNSNKRWLLLGEHFVTEIQIRFYLTFPMLLS